MGAFPRGKTMLNYINTVLTLIAAFVIMFLVLKIVSIDWRDSQRIDYEKVQY